MSLETGIASLFEDYGDVVYRRCVQLLKDDELAFDAVQEVFMRALTAKEPFRGDSSPLTWLYRIATTYCLQQMRNRNRRRLKLDEMSKGLCGAHVPHIEETISLGKILDEQDDDVRQMAYCRFVDGMSLEEVAEVTCFSRKTVSKKLKVFVAKARLDLEHADGAGNG